MSSPRYLLRRIRSISSTSQITRAMQMVAASKMRKAQEAALSTRPFVHLFYAMQREATCSMGKLAHPLLESREVRNRAVILVSTDKGLCGSLNSNLFRAALDFDIASTVYVAAGRRAAQFVARTGRRLVAEFTYGDIPTISEARAITSFAKNLYIAKTVDQVLVVSTQFINTLTQHTLTLEFLPVGEIHALKIPGTEHIPHERSEGYGYLFEPSASHVMAYLIPHYLDVYIYQVLLNARASEQSARMVSMKNATDNAEDLIRDLTLEYNKLRQGNITRELLEIAGGRT
ncbi:MAG: ATP synthase F1 subunit gamma, partial [Candidatus Korobacteraceae bacterium]